MNIMHPDDRTLERYLNKHIDELMNKRVALHLRACPDCRRRLAAFVDMELLLENMPLLDAPSGLSDRVMEALRQEPPMAAERPALKQETAGKKTFWRTELANGLVATAATFLFIYSGAMGKLISLDAYELEAGVRSGTRLLFQTIELLSKQLLT